jgi:hypothetical protein
MNERDLDVALVGAIKALLKDSRYFYMGYKGHLTEEGRAAVTGLIDLFGERMYHAEQAALNQRAKDMVVKELKG